MTDNYTESGGFGLRSALMAGAIGAGAVGTLNNIKASGQTLRDTARRAGSTYGKNQELYKAVNSFAADLSAQGQEVTDTEIKKFME